uniref:Eukaryotic translation initiation factor 2 alpha kinase 2 n=1 Tax=Malurus cyaneus samueli TaxID=2593467 RepID=A0A8C5X1G7_9PASS
NWAGSAPRFVLHCVKMDREYMEKLNHYSQIHNLSVVYDTIDVTGPSHDPQFTVVAKINGEVYGTGTGKSKKDAKAVAAKKTWEMIDEQDKSPSNMAAAELRTTQTTSSSPLDNYVSLLNNFSQRTMQMVDYTNIIRSGDAHAPTKMAANFANIRNKEEEKAMSDSDGSFPDVDTNTGEENGSGFLFFSSRFLEQYKEIEPIGEGGFGNVFKATSKSDEKTYAIKRVEFTEKVQREAIGLASLTHENIVRYHSSWKGPDHIKYPYSSRNSDKKIDCLFIQMEFCEQGTLENWIAQHREDRNYHVMAQEKFLQIVKGVEYIHSKKLIHRDLKPQNIFISHDDKIKIGDFGLVTSVTFETLTENRGTKSYMAPEQVIILYGKEVDIYALGLIWFEILAVSTGHEKIKVWPSVRQGKLPEHFINQFPSQASIIKKMLSTDPAARMTISHLLDLLKSIDKKEPLKNFSY